MRKSSFYLEAASRTQDLLTLKWSLRAAGHAVESTWHEGEVSAAGPANRHWGAERMEQLRACDSLVILFGRGTQPSLELGVMLGYAVANGLRVIWIGPGSDMLGTFRAVERFETIEDLRKEILQQTGSRYEHAGDQRLAA